MAILKTIRKTIIALVFGGVLTWVVFACWIHVSYASNLPETLDVKSGRIHRMVVNHGFVRYGSERELRRLRWMDNSASFVIVCFLMAIIIGIRYGDFHIRQTGRKP
jgi:hypothetical protein